MQWKITLKQKQSDLSSLCENSYNQKPDSDSKWDRGVRKMYNFLSFSLPL